MDPLSIALQAAPMIVQGLMGRKQGQGDLNRARDMRNAALGAEQAALGRREYQLGDSWNKYLAASKQDRAADLQRDIASQQEASTLGALQSGGAKALLGGLQGAQSQSAQQRMQIEADSQARQQAALGQYAGVQQGVMDANVGLAAQDVDYQRGLQTEARDRMDVARGMKRAGTAAAVTGGLGLGIMGLGQAFAPPTESQNKYGGKYPTYSNGGKPTPTGSATPRHKRRSTNTAPGGIGSTLSALAQYGPGRTYIPVGNDGSGNVNPKRQGTQNRFKDIRQAHRLRTLSNPFARGTVVNERGETVSGREKRALIKENRVERQKARDEALKEMSPQAYERRLRRSDSAIEAGAEILRKQQTGRNEEQFSYRRDTGELNAPERKYTLEEMLAFKGQTSSQDPNQNTGGTSVVADGLMQMATTHPNSNKLRTNKHGGKYAKGGVQKTPGLFSHAKNPIDIMKDGAKIGEMTGGEYIFNPRQASTLQSLASKGGSPLHRYVRNLLQEFDRR